MTQKTSLPPSISPSCDIRTPIFGATFLVATTLSAFSDPLALVNGDFETGTDGTSGLSPIAGWTDNGGSDASNRPGFWLQDGTGGGSFPQDPSEPQAGALYLSANRLVPTPAAASQPASSTLSQTVAIDGSNLALAQSGTALIKLQFYYQDTDTADSSTVSLSFLDSSSGLITSITTGTLPNVATAGAAYNSVTAPWTFRSLEGQVPSNAESLRIDITTNRSSGTATNVHFDSFSAQITPEDSDGDGLPDSYEQTIISADPSDSIATLADVMGTGASPMITDFDNDGSSDAKEYDDQTNPLAPDSDDDGLLDGAETYTGFYNGPNDTGTDPLDPDWDRDGFKDGTEVFFGTDPFLDDDMPGLPANVINPGFEDPVMTISTEGIPVSGGTVTGWSVATNEMWVTDGLLTGANDPTFASEGFQFLTSNRLAPNPDAAATGFTGGNAAIMSARQDVDVTSFAADIDAGARTILVNFDWFDNDPYDRGTVSIRFLDGMGSDLGRYRTGVTLGNPGGWQTSTLPVYPPAGTRTIRITLAADNRNDAGAQSATGTVRNAHFDNIVAHVAYRDYDEDQMADDWEHANGLDPDESNDAENQDDGDTLSNLQEFQAGTNPKLADTDGDTYNDDIELAAGSDPLDAASFPTITPLQALIVESSGFNVGGDFEITVSGLSPSRSYRLVRGADLMSFPHVAEEKVPVGASEMFTDTEPPTGKAFYRVELVPAP